MPIPLCYLVYILCNLANFQSAGVTIDINEKMFNHNGCYAMHHFPQLSQVRQI